MTHKNRRRDTLETPRVIAFPSSGIAYNESFYSALESQGAEVIEGCMSGRWLAHNVRSTDVIHLHWPSFMYEPSSSSLSNIALAFIRFIILLTVMRVKAKKIFWTAHNLLPHSKNALPLIDVFARHIIISMVSNIFVHGAEAEIVLLKRFPRAKGKTVRIPHGNWIDRYQPKQTKESGRCQLDLPGNSFIYLLFGQCKPYKNIEALVRVFLDSSREDDYLLIAGRFSDNTYLSKIKKAAAGDPRIRIDNRFIPDNEVSSYLSASDAMCVPYREILTSGTAMLSISFGKPVYQLIAVFCVT